MECSRRCGQNAEAWSLRARAAQWSVPRGLVRLDGCSQAHKTRACWLLRVESQSAQSLLRVQRAPALSRWDRELPPVKVAAARVAHFQFSFRIASDLSTLTDGTLLRGVSALAFCLARSPPASTTMIPQPNGARAIALSMSCSYTKNSRRSIDTSTASCDAAARASPGDHRGVRGAAAAVRLPPHCGCRRTAACVWGGCVARGSGFGQAPRPKVARPRCAMRATALVAHRSRFPASAVCSHRGARGPRPVRNCAVPRSLGGQHRGRPGEGVGRSAAAIGPNSVRRHPGLLSSRVRCLCGQGESPTGPPTAPPRQSAPRLACRGLQRKQRHAPQRH